MVAAPLSVDLKRAITPTASTLRAQRAVCTVVTLPADVENFLDSLTKENLRDRNRVGAPVSASEWLRDFGLKVMSNEGHPERPNVSSEGVEG